MSESEDITRQLRGELDETRARLAEAEQALDAIRHGEVDGLMMAGPAGEQVFTLQGAQEPYRLLIEQMSEGALTLSQEGVILYANQTFARLLQTPLERVIGAEFRSFVPPADQSAFAALLAAAWAGGGRGEVSVLAADGSSIPLRLGMSRLQMDPGTLVCVVATDLTEERKKEAELRGLHADLERRVIERTHQLAASRLAALSMMEDAVEARQVTEGTNRQLHQEMAERQQAEAALRDSESHFRQLAESLPQLVWTGLPDGRCDYLSRQWVEFTGLPEAAQLGAGWLNQVHPDDRAGLARNWTEAIASGDVLQVEFRIRRHDGVYRWFDTRAVPLRDESARVVKWFGSNTDITERIQGVEEIRQLNATLEQRVAERTAQLLAANQELEAFSYSISHDLRAPLRGVDGYVRMLTEDCAGQLDAEGRRLLGVVSSEARRMGELIDDLLAFSRMGRQRLEHSAVDMTALAGSVLESAAAAALAAPPRFVLHPLPPAQGDLAMLRQVFTNLICNAVKFSRRQPEPLVEIGALPRGEPGGPVTYFVRDNGVGFDPRYSHKLFGVFQRLHSEAEFEGTGVGLALVQRIIHRHGGEIRAEGRLDAGATFYFTLPSHAEKNL